MTDEWILFPQIDEIGLFTEEQYLFILNRIKKKGLEMVYIVDDKMKARLDNDFVYHSPFGDQPQRYVTIREAAKTLAWTIVTLSPPSREQSVALTLLDQVVMMTNSAIARNEKEPEK